MKIYHETLRLSDAASVESELEFGDIWDVPSVSSLMRSKCGVGESPAFLFLGKKETELLREHLAKVFGQEAVVTLNETYHMGLKVVEISCESFFFIGGRKKNHATANAMIGRPLSRDRDADLLWNYRI
jgi:hypothetical protein